MQRHYELHLGAALEVTALHRGVRVLSFDSPLGTGVVLATDGVRRIAASPGQRGIEFVMPCRPAHAHACARMLCDLAHYPREQGTTLRWFHVLPLGVGIVLGSDLTSLLLTMPWFGTADFFTAELDERVEVVHVIPITDREREVFRTSGADGLEAALEDADADLTDLHRTSVI